MLPDADVCIVLIADEIPPAYQPYSEYIRVCPPVPGMHTAFQAQCIRLLYPRQIARDQGVLITDMDMLPMNRSYYVDSIASLATDAFVVYRDVCLPGEISMCYNVAHPSVWTAIFGSRPTQEVLTEWYRSSGYDGVHGGQGWGTDQKILVRAFNEWAGPKIILNDSITKFARLDRAMPMNMWDRERSRIQKLILEKYFADYHCLRPYSQFKSWNDWVLCCLQESLQGS